MYQSESFASNATIDTCQTNKQIVEQNIVPVVVVVESLEKKKMRTFLPTPLVVAPAAAPRVSDTVEIPLESNCQPNPSDLLVTALATIHTNNSSQNLNNKKKNFDFRNFFLLTRIRKRKKNPQQQQQQQKTNRKHPLQVLSSSDSSSSFNNLATVVNGTNVPEIRILLDHMSSESVPGSDHHPHYHHNNHHNLSQSKLLLNKLQHQIKSNNAVKHLPPLSSPNGNAKQLHSNGTVAKLEESELVSLVSTLVNDNNTTIVQNGTAISTSNDCDHRHQQETTSISEQVLNQNHNDSDCQIEVEIGTLSLSSTETITADELQTTTAPQNLIRNPSVRSLSTSGSSSSSSTSTSSSTSRSSTSTSPKKLSFSDNLETEIVSPTETIVLVIDQSSKSEKFVTEVGRSPISLLTSVIESGNNLPQQQDDELILETLRKVVRICTKTDLAKRASASEVFGILEECCDIGGFSRTSSTSRSATNSSGTSSSYSNSSSTTSSSSSSSASSSPTSSLR